MTSNLLFIQGVLTKAFSLLLQKATEAHFLGHPPYSLYHETS